MEDLPRDTSSLNLLCTLSLDVATAINANPSATPFTLLHHHHFPAFAATRSAAQTPENFESFPASPAFVANNPDTPHSFAYRKRARTDLQSSSEHRRHARQLASRNASNLLSTPPLLHDVNRTPKQDPPRRTTIQRSQLHRLSSDPPQPRSLPPSKFNYWQQSCLPRKEADSDAETYLAAPVMQMSDFDTSSSSSTPQSGYLAGTLRKRCRTSRLSVRRYFVLKSNILFNYKSKKSRLPTWKLNLSGAVVGMSRSTLRIVIMLDGARRVVLLATSLADAEKWTNALAHAADTASSFASTPERTLSRHSKDVTTDSPVRVTGDPYTKNETFDDTFERALPYVPENDTWDSFRSLATLDIRTNRKGNDWFLRE